MIDPLDIHAYADGELLPEERARVEKEIAADDAATAELMRVRELKECLHSKVEPIDASSVWPSCVSRLDEIDRTRRVEGFVGRYAWGLCALFLLAIVGGGVFNRINHQTVNSGDVARYISGAFASSPSSVSDPRVRYVEQRLDSLLNQVQAARERPLKLIARYDRVAPDGRYFARFELEDEKGPLTLVVIPGMTDFDMPQQTDASGDFGYGKIGSESIVSWVDDNVGLAIKGSRSPQELQTIAQRIRITAPR